MIPITNALLTSRRNRPFLRDPQKYRIYDLKGVIVHWTANTMNGANAWANRNYFNSTDRYASAHYMVDDHHILQCLPDHEVGYHVGARTYKPIGKSLMDGNKNPNYFVIGIEMCVNADGDWDKTYQNSVELTQYLLNLHNFTIHQLWRHYDITGKDCPKMMIDEAPWQAFRKDVNEGLKLSLRDPVKKGTIRVDDFLNVREGNGTSYGVVDRLHDGDSVEIYDEFDNWVRVGDNKWIHGDYVDINESRRTGRVKVEGDNLNVRQGPGTRFSIVGKLQNGDTVEIIDSQGVWFKLNASGNEEQWVHSHYITFEEYPKGIVTSEKLVVRDGPGTNFSKILRLTEGDIVEIQETEGHWYRIGENQWVIRNYIKTVSLS